MSAKHWLITGVSSGLGRALASAALSRGDAVVGTVREPDAARAFEALAPERAHALLIDLANTAAVPAMMTEAAGQLGGRLDIVVNNAGHALAGAVEEISTAEAERLLAVNFLAPLAICRAALPLLRAAGGGRIINISSMAALEGYRGLGLYCATKAALSAATEALAIEVAPSGVFATAVEAAGLRTAFAGRSLAQASNRFLPYEAMRAEMAAAFHASDGRQRNDPEKAAQSILALIALDAPPRHFALGGEAVQRIAHIFESRLEEYERCRALGGDTLADG